MRIVLIHPPIPSMADRRVSPPLGILYIASYLRERFSNITIDVIDQNLNDDISVKESVNQVLNRPADIYGLSFGTTQYKYVVAISRALKERYPDSMVVCGGAHASAEPGETLEDTRCDLIVESEGEETMMELVKNRIQRKNSPHEVKGLYYLSEDKEVIYTGARQFITDLNVLPIPARDLINLDKYTRTINGEKATTIITSRGCPARCIFCSQHSWRYKLRMRSVENIIAEIDEIQEKFGINNFLFLDDTLTAEKGRIFKLCDELKKRNIMWRGWTRANAISNDLADKMAASNCKVLCIGVESGSQKILDNLKKGTQVEQNREAIKIIKKVGMSCRVSLMVGAPGETWETVNKTVDFVLETQPDDWLLSIFVPVPGSEAFRYPEKFKLKILKGKDRISFYDNFFVTGGEMISGKVIEYPNLQMREIEEMRDYIYNALMEKCDPKLYNATGIK